MMTVGDVVREVAAGLGFSPGPDEVKYVLWEHTGFPCFWPDSTSTPEENLRAQVREFYIERASERGCGT